MNVQAGLQAVMFGAVGAAFIAVVTPRRWRNVAAGISAALVATAAAVTGAAALTGLTGVVRTSMPVPLDVPLSAMVWSPDRLGGLFMLVAGAVSAVAACYAIGYVHGPAQSRTGWVSFVVFIVGMCLVPAASDVVSFLLAWELMALGSAVLVLSEHKSRAAARSAALWYVMMTHASFMLLMAGFAIPAAQAGSTSFSAMGGVRLPVWAAGISFMLLTLGFATKAGLVPLHVWLPQAHPEAPSHASAVMSAAMVKMGVYGMFVMLLRIFPGQHPRWWALVLVGLGLISALYGILQASVASDVKRLLAYSTTENLGLITTAIGVWVLLSGSTRPEQVAVAHVAVIAALSLVISHAAFKTALFLGAGAVVHATGVRDLDRMGGLITRMPVTAFAWGVASLGAAALPISSGFVAEWMLLQSIIHGDRSGDRAVAATLPIAVGVVALTAGLALLTFVKAYGIAFVARPRSQEAACAQEVPWSMRLGMLVAALAVILLGLVPGPVASVVATAVNAGGVTQQSWGGVQFPAVQASLNPLAITALMLSLALPFLLVNVVLARRHPRRATDMAWGCGGVRTSPRMEYTATSYAEPLARIFKQPLQLRRTTTIQQSETNRHVIHEVTFRQDWDDVVDERGYLPVRHRLLRMSEWFARLHNGNLYRYLSIALGTFLVVLVVSVW